MASAALDERGPGFEHIEAQEADAVHSIALDDAERAISTNQTVSVMPADLPTQRYTVDARTGVISIEARDGSSVVLAPQDRASVGPADISTNDSTVRASNVTADIDEVTVTASDAFEQHFIVDDAAADERIVRRWGVALPPSWHADWSMGELRFWSAGDLVAVVNATYAKDEVGNTVPVDLAWDADTSTMSITYDGSRHDTVGDVAIDPAYELGGANGEYQFVICQDVNSVPCTYPVLSTPEYFTKVSATPGRFVMELGTNSWGPTIGVNMGSTISINDQATMRWSVPASWNVIRAFFELDVFDNVTAPTPTFRCRPGINFAGGSVDGSGFSVFTAGPGSSRPFTQLLTAPPTKSITSFDIGLEKYAGADVVPTADHQARCWMPSTGAARSEIRLTLTDTTPPSVSQSPGGVASIVPLAGVIGPEGQWVLPSTESYEQARWYKEAEQVTFGLTASDGQSGVKYGAFEFSNPLGAKSGVIRGLSDACVTIAGDWQTNGPCPTTVNNPGLADIVLDAGLNLQEGVNAFWVRATDFAGNDRYSGENYFLYDSKAPPSPTNISGTGSVDGEIVDAEHTVDVTWVNPPDDGELAMPRRGSGVVQVLGDVQIRDDANAWQSFKDGQMSSRFVPLGAMATRASFDTRLADGTVPPTNRFRYQLRSVDRAGNTGNPSGWHHVTVDTTPPALTLLQPNPDATLRAEIRDPTQSIDFKIRASEELPGDLIDSIGIQTRPYNPLVQSPWTTRVANASQASGTYSYPLSFASSGEVQIKGVAEDGPHTNETGVSRLCADVSIWPTQPGFNSSWLARSVSVHDLLLGGSMVGTRLKVTVPPRYQLHPRTTAWVIERRLSPATGWKFVGRFAASNATSDTTAIYDSFEPVGSSAEFRVSPVTLKCASSGAEPIAVVGVRSDSESVSSRRLRAQQLLGLDDRWTFHEMPLGGDATAHTNVAVGNQVITRPLLTDSAQGMEVTASLAYNSQQHGDDDELAMGGLVGTQWQLSMGTFGAPSGSLRLSAGTAVLTDASGTRRAFRDLGSGTYDSPSEYPYRLHRVDARTVRGQVAHYELVGVDGMTYYFADHNEHRPAEATTRLAPLVVMMDRFGNAATFEYECVGVNRGPVSMDATPLRVTVVGDRLEGAKRTVQNPDVQARCPRLEHTSVAALTSIERRLVRVAFLGTTRQWDLTYDDNGHIATIVRSGAKDPDRTITLTHETIDGSRLKTLASVAESVAGTYAPRTTKFTYRAVLDDPGEWFDARTLVRTVSDFRGSTSRFSYTVPDLANKERSNPRVARIENRIDVAADDRRGITFDHGTSDGGVLSGVTAVEDQEGRRTTYRFEPDIGSPEFGIVTAITEPSGLVTQIDRATLVNGVRTITTTRSGSFVRDEPVALVGTSPSMLRDGPAQAGTLAITGTGSGSAGLVSVRPDGQIAYTEGSPTTVRKFLVSYRPARVSVDSVDVHVETGRVLRATQDQSTGVTPAPRTLSDPVRRFATTRMTWAGNGATRGDGPAWSRPMAGFVTDLVAMRSPRDHVSSFEVAAGRVNRSSVVVGNGEQTASTTYERFPSGLPFRITHPDGSVQLMWNYDETGAPRRVTPRLALPAAASATRPATDADEGAALWPLPHVETKRDSRGLPTCVIDRRGSGGYGNRFATFSYDAWGSLVRETSTYRTVGGVRQRRVTTHDYDENGNRRFSVHDAVYEPQGLDDCAGIGPVVRNGVSAPQSLRDDGVMRDAEYDLLDREVVSRALSNSDADRPRVSATEYSRAGDVIHTVEPRGVATAQGGDYALTTRYDQAGRPVSVEDGEGRFACSYFNAFGEVVLHVAPRWQQRKQCADAPIQGFAERTAYDNSGRAVWVQSVSGGVVDRAYDLDSNVTATSQLVGTPGSVQWRTTRSTFGAGSNVVAASGASREVCSQTGLGSCDTKRQTHVPVTTYAYDLLNRVTSITRPRARIEGVRDVTSYAYDPEGRTLRETTTDGDGRDTTSHTEYDAFGNAKSVTLPGRSVRELKAKGLVTTFTYNEDGSPASKDDVAHDNRVKWTYDARGNMVERIEEGADFGPGRERNTVLEYTYYDDGSLRTEPAPVPKYVAGSVYARGACVRPSTAGEDADRSASVYQITTSQAQVVGPSGIRWSSLAYDQPVAVDLARKMQVTRRRDVDTHRVYDENGQLDSIRQCGNRIEFSQRTNDGQLVEVKDMFNDVMRFAYDGRGDLVETVYDSGISEKRSYVAPTGRTDDLTPGAGAVESVRLRNDQARRTLVGSQYEYELDGALARSERLEFDGAKSPSADTVRSVTSGMKYAYDDAGLLAQIETHRGVGRSSKTLMRQQIWRDAAGNPRRIIDSVSLVMSDGSDSRPRSREREWQYDAAGRVARDKAGVGNPLRDYGYDPTGRLLEVVARGVVVKGPAKGARSKALANVVMERYSYGGEARVRGAMRPVTHDSRELVSKPLERSFLSYGNGRTERAMWDHDGKKGTAPIARPGSVPGPLGQLVQSERMVGLERRDAQRSATFTVFSALGQVQRATTRDFESSVRTCRLDAGEKLVTIAGKVLQGLRGCPGGWTRVASSKSERAVTKSVQRGRRLILALERAGEVSSELAMYDPFGRQFQSVTSVDDNPRDGAFPVQRAQRRYYVAEAMDPFAEVSLGGAGIGTRWIMRGPDGIFGELRDNTTRYLFQDHQSSTRMMLDGTKRAELTATFDYDTFGAAYESDNELSLASGTADEHEDTAYGYTGMRTRSAAGTTNHHARDYNADLRTWLQTDQYMDPWRDLGLSMDPTTRDRHAYAGGNPVSNVDPDGHRYFFDHKDGGRVEYMPSKGGGSWRGEHGGGTCNCTSTHDGRGFGNVRVDGGSYAGTSRQVRSVVRSVRSNRSALRSALSSPTLYMDRGECGDFGLNMTSACDEQIRGNVMDSSSSALSGILRNSGMQFAADGLSGLELSLLADARAVELGYTRGTASTIHGNASLAQLGKLGMTAGGPFLDFADGALYSWNANSGMTPVNRAAGAFNTGAATAAGGAAGGAGGYWACKRMMQSQGIGPGRAVRAAGAVCGGVAGYFGGEAGKAVGS